MNSPSVITEKSAPAGLASAPTPSQAVYTLINTANPSLPNGALDSTNTTLGAVAAAASGTVPNTSLLITAVAGEGYTGEVTVLYNRLDIQADVFSVLAPGGATVVNSGGAMATVADVVAALNSTYNTLTVEILDSDISNDTDALSLVNDAGSVTLTVASTSLAYTGTLAVQITQEQYYLQDVVTATTVGSIQAPVS